MSLTGLTKQLEEAFLKQIREEELRARRALRILEHQQEEIRKLKEMMSHQNNSEMTQGKLRSEDENNNLVDLMELILCQQLMDMQVDNEISLTRVSKNDQKKSIPQNPRTNGQLTKIQKEVFHTQNVLLNSKRKIESLEAMVQELQESNSEVNLLMNEMSGWRSTIDNALVNLETVNCVISDRVWTTALQFFTPSEAIHFLSSQKMRRTKLPKNEQKSDAPRV